MLTEHEIINKVENSTETNYINLKYSFVFNDSNKIVYNNCNVEEKITSAELSFFHKKLKDHRLVLTIGKLIKRLSEKTVDKSIRFGENDCIIDLEALSDGYFLKPNETVLILTNEWIELDQNTYIQIFSKVSNYAKGISVTASFVDSQWQGLIQLMVTNHSTKARALKIGDEIASAFFMELFGNQTSTKNNHASDAAHFKNNWQSIISEKNDPFSPSKKEKDVSLKQKIKDLLIRHKTKIIGFATSATVLAIIPSIFKFYSEIRDISEFKKMTKENNEILKTIKDELHNRNIESGKGTILITKNDLTGSRSFELNRTQTNSKCFIQNIKPTIPPNSSIDCEIITSGGKSFLEVKIMYDDISSKDRNFQFDWFVIPN